jgi:hypothetical protein
MTQDIRLACGSRHHPKLRKLARRLGKAAQLAWVWLLCYVGEFFPNGRLEGVDVADLSDEIEWDGDIDILLNTLLDLRLLDRVEDGILEIHDWLGWNAYVANYPARKFGSQRANHIKALRGAPCTTTGCRFCTEPVSDLMEGGDRTGTESVTPPSPSSSLSPTKTEEEVDEGVPVPEKTLTEPQAQIRDIVAAFEAFGVQTPTPGRAAAVNKTFGSTRIIAKTRELGRKGALADARSPIGLVVKALDSEETRNGRERTGYGHGAARGDGAGTTSKRRRRYAEDPLDTYDIQPG